MVIILHSNDCFLQSSLNVFYNFIEQKKKKFQTNNAGEIHEASIVSSSKSTDDRLSMSEILEQKKNEKLKEKSAEYLALRDQLLQSKRAIHVITGEESEKVSYLSFYQRFDNPLFQNKIRPKFAI